MDINTKRILLTIQPKETKTIHLMQPCNYFRVRNGGDSSLYCGLTSIPTKRLYDFKVIAKGAKLHCEQRTYTYFYMYNDSSSPTEVVLTYYNAPFDASVTAFGDMETTINQSTTSIEITGFTESLPRGNNKIGIVQLENGTEIENHLNRLYQLNHALKNRVDEINVYFNEKLTAIADSGDKILKEVKKIEASQSDIDGVINYIMDKSTEIEKHTKEAKAHLGNIYTRTDLLETLAFNRNMFSDRLKSLEMSANSNLQTLNIENVKYYKLIINDGPADLELFFNNIDGSSERILLKNKEKLENFTIRGNLLKFKSPSSTIFRVIAFQ